MSKKLHLLITIYFLLSSLIFQYSYSEEETEEKDTEEDEFSCASEDFPFLVAIVSILTNKLKCEGSLIDACWVLTAAHCLTKKDKYRIVAGLSSYPTNRIEREANEIFIHPQYSESQRTNDIGLIKFTEPIPESPYVKYILIPIRIFAKSYISEICERGLTVQWGHENTSSTYRTAGPVLSSLTCCFVPMTIKQNCKVIHNSD